MRRRRRRRCRRDWPSTRSAAAPHRAAPWSRGKLGERAAEIDQAIDREHADAAAIGQDGEPLAGKRLQAPERLGGVEQLLEIEHAQQAGPAERRVVDRIRSRERAGVGCGGLGALAYGGPP